MVRVDVYIDYNFKGNFASGTGKASIILEMIKDNIPHTREHYCGYLNTTNQRLCILACINALKKFKQNCEIEIHIDSAYLEQSINNGKPEEWLVNQWTSKGKEVKNRDLWKEYLYLAKNHLIVIKNEKVNSYSGAQEIQLRNRKIELQEDIRE